MGECNLNHRSVQSYWRDCLAIVIVLFAILMLFGCTRPICVEMPCGPGRMCSMEDRTLVESVKAPTFPISGTTGCAAQLLATMEHPSYAQNESVIAIVMVRTLGDCSWPLWESAPFEVDYAATQIVREVDGNVPLTEQGQMWLESPEDVYSQCYDQPRICGSRVLSSEIQMCQRLQLNKLFDLSVPGTYSMTMVRNNRHDELNVMYSNVISFTITP
jgi:hypothetical protein